MKVLLSSYVSNTKPNLSFLTDAISVALIFGLKLLGLFAVTNGTAVAFFASFTSPIKC